MFGKNYDVELKEIRDALNVQIKNLNETIKQQNNITDMFSEIKKNMIDIAKVQATHKESITFLLNHANVDEGAKDDFFKMLKNIAKQNEKIKN